MKLDRRVRTSLISICTDVLLISIKLVTAFLTGSLAILADALHSFSDLVVSCTVLTSILLRKSQERRASQRAAHVSSPEDGIGGEPPAERGEEAASGYWAESFVAFFVSLVILYTAYEIVSRVMARPPDQIRNVALGIMGITACIGIAYFISQFKIMVGRETDSPALVADGYHSRMDMFTSIAVVLSIMGQWVGIKLDPIVAVVIAVIIAITGINLFISSFISFARKSHIRVSESWDALLSLLDAVVGFVSQRILGRRITLPRTDLSKLQVRAWFSRRRLAAIAVLLFIIYLASGSTAVRPGEVGVRFRFGAIVNDHLEPGLHFGLPRPFERIRKVNAFRVYGVEVGFRTDPTVFRVGSRLLWEAKHQVPGYQKVYHESLGFTGDESLVDISILVHYRPLDAVVHLFKVNKINEIMRGLAESHMREVLATESASLLMTERRARWQKRLKDVLNHEVEVFGLGVEVLDVFCHDVHPPLETIPAFRDVFSAREDKSKYINEAQSYRNSSLPRARAKREGQIADAFAYEREKELRAEGDAQRFLFTARAYHTVPEVTAYRLFLETVEQGLAGKKKYIANPRANLGGYRLWLFTPGAPAEGF
jgi:membrane protease subunit HflK